jgi:hypothetical protein
MITTSNNKKIVTIKVGDALIIMPEDKFRIEVQEYFSNGELVKVRDYEFTITREKKIRMKRTDHPSKVVPVAKRHFREIL